MFKRIGASTKTHRLQIYLFTESKEIRGMRSIASSKYLIPRSGHRIPRIGTTHKGSTPRGTNLIVWKDSRALEIWHRTELILSKPATAGEIWQALSQPRRGTP
jgi:hypothetical protein